MANNILLMVDSLIKGHVDLLYREESKVCDDFVYI